MPDASTGQPGAAAISEAPGGAKFVFVAGDPEMYYVPPSQTPAAKYLKAVAFLAGGAGRRAAALIAEAADGLFGSAGASRDQPGVQGPVSRTAIAYHWILAIMSGRAFEQLTRRDLTDIDRARRIADTDERGALPDAYGLLCQILDKLRAGDAAASPVTVDCGDVTAEYRAQIYRHLGTMLMGRTTEQSEAALAASATAPGVNVERAARAWKYFEPVPAEPRRRADHKPVFPWQDRLLAVAAGVMWLVAVPLAIGVLQERGAVRAIILSAVILLASVVTMLSRIAELAAMERIADRDGDFGERHVGRYSRRVATPASDEVPVDPGDDAEAERARRTRVRLSRFTRLVANRIDEQFAKLTPVSPTARLRWTKETTGPRDSIRNEMLLLYGDTAARPGAVNWLIDARVSEIGEAIKRGTARAYRQQMQPWTGAVLGFALGAVVGVVAWGYAAYLVLIQRPVQGAIALVLLGFAVVLVALSRFDVYLVGKRRLPKDRADADQRYQADLTAYKQWQGKIADPPTDHQVANWLDLDKIALMKRFMTQPGMSGQDVLAHATLIEPGPGCVGRRLPNGPPRYSAYKVTIFLLTRAGVRVAAVTLDFLTGEALDPVRRAFRYDTIMSARVQVDGIRYAAGSRNATPAPAFPSANGQNGLSGGQDIFRRNVDGSVILRQDFRLSIKDGEGLRFLVENFEAVDASPGGGAAEPEHPEDPVNLLDLALDTSGVGPALELLEVVCGHGDPWVQEQIQRRSHPETGELADAGVS
ncbi:MAG: hypothetical protein ACLQFR_21005 [Streptosporangiaceae bacterium]